jgi:hypothetical protein
MKALDVEGRRGRARPPAGYAVLGIGALALSLVGVMGGHQLVGKVFGVPEEEQALALGREGNAECPAHLRAADACDFDGDASVAREGDEGCSNDPTEEDAVSLPHVRRAAAHSAATAPLETLTPGR